MTPSMVPVVAVLLCLCICVKGQEKFDPRVLNTMEEEITGLMEEGDIPGLSIVLIDNNRQAIKSFGWADMQNRRPVEPHTLFEIGSCTKAFTALAVTRLAGEMKINLDENVSYYLPWFRVSYQDSTVQITLRQLLHHTSGIPWETISKIPVANDNDALEATIRQLIDQPLNALPGTQYEYATINYDVLALIVQIVSGMPFEVYAKHYVIHPLNLKHTAIGNPFRHDWMARGYKIGFFSAREYDAPVFRGNFAAGYVVTNATDMAKWLHAQMGVGHTPFATFIATTHLRDETVPLHGMDAYACGWQVSLDGRGTIFHGGMNPNFSAYIAFRPGSGLGVAVLTNANSAYTQYIGEVMLKRLAGEKNEKKIYPDDGSDGLFSMVAIVLLLYTLVVVFFIGKSIAGIIGDKRRRHISVGTFVTTRMLPSAIFLVPFLYGIYSLPQAMAGFSWQAITIWLPVSFVWMMNVLIVSVALTYVAYGISVVYPDPDRYRRMIPPVILLSVLSGLANVVIVIMVTSGIYIEHRLSYYIFYYGLTIVVYLLGRRYVQIKLIEMARGHIYDLNIQLTNKVFSTSYENFEKIDKGRVYATFHDDITIIGQSTQFMLTLVTSLITAIGAFVYLASIAAWSTLIVLVLVVVLACLYYFVSQHTRRYFEEARNSRNVFMQYFNGMVEGFRELSLHGFKKDRYKEDLATSTAEFRDKISYADIRFVNTFLVGESLLVILLGFVSYGMHPLFPSLPFTALTSFIVVLLYLIGPINGILNSVPLLMRLKVSWRRVTDFVNEIPVQAVRQTSCENERPADIHSIRTAGIVYRYPSRDGEEVFEVGPIDLCATRGQIIFIVGGNGSGKTTLAKLLTGLYAPAEGAIFINDRSVEPYELGEYYAPVFTNPYLFNKIYTPHVAARKNEIGEYLALLDLAHKVTVTGDVYSTIDLSVGQRKRLALLQCYLEDRPIYLFDEWAADQDPHYRHIFYRKLLPDMKKSGKIVIAITHDDHYFDVADSVLKMDRGKLATFDKNLWPHQVEHANRAV